MASMMIGETRQRYDRMQGTTITETWIAAGTQRYLGTCWQCKAKLAIDAQYDACWNTQKQCYVTKDERGMSMSFACPHCAASNSLISARIKELKATQNTQHKCDTRCIHAHQAVCDCSCGGANHGAGHLF